MKIKKGTGFFRLANLIIPLLIITPTWAATITVETLDDTNAVDCTLRDAITAANTDFATNGCTAGDAGQDTIRFLFNGTITLASALPSLSSNITISGPGSANLIISGGGSTVIKVDGSGVIITGLTITGGNSGSFGGGLWVTGGGEAQGNDLLITANNAIDGGGVANGGILTLTNSTVANNTSSVANLGGVGIYNSGTLTLNTVSVTGNNTSSGANGGGIYNNTTGTLSIANASVSNNSINGGNGAGIYNAGTISSFSGNTIDNNTGASMGGGIYSGTSITVSESTITVNTASSSGGGMHVMGTATIVDSSVTSNTATAMSSFGGGVNATTIVLTRSLVSGNSTQTAGGGLYAGSYSITNSTISNNSANASGFGGAAYLGGGDTLTMVNSTVTGNSATAEGGGIWNAGTVNFSNSIISNNTASNCQSPMGSGTWNSNGYNIENTDTCGLGAVGDQVNTNPMLAATLQDNGGPTLTYALLTGSPAIDTGNDTGCPATDQRGANRPQDGDNDMTASCDIGAFEVGVLPDTGNGNGFGDEGGGCFIATAAYGTAMANDVRYLRAFRDQYLLTNQWGKKFVSWYYDVSPSMADRLRKHDSVRSVVRMLLKPLVWLSKAIVDQEIYRQQTEDQP